MPNATATTCWGVALWLGIALPVLPRSTPPDGHVVPAVRPYESGWSASLDANGSLLFIVGRSHVITASSSGRLSALSSIDGHEIWSRAAEPATALAAGDDLIFVASASRLIAIDEASGRTRWTAELPAVAIAPTWRAGWLLAASGNELRAYRAADGAPIWTRDLGAPVAATAVNGDRVFVATGDKRVGMLDITSGATVGTPLDLDGVPAGLLAANNRVYFGLDSGFHAYRDTDLRFEWRRSDSSRLIGEPVTDERNVYFTGFDNTVRAVGRETGNLRWLTPLTSRPAAGLRIVGGHVVIPLISGELMLCLVADGRTAARLAVPTTGEGSTRLLGPVQVAGLPETPVIVRVIDTLSGARSIVTNRPATLPVEPLTVSPGTPVDLVAPRLPLARH